MREREAVLILGHNDGMLFVDIYNKYIKAFDKNKYVVTLAFLTGEPSKTTTMHSLADETIFFNFPKAAIRGLKIKAILHLIRFCKAKKFNIIICHRYKPIYIMSWVAQRYTLPMIIFVMHAIGTMDALHRKLLAFFLNKKNMVYAGVSHAVKKDLAHHLWGRAKHHVMVLPNSIEIEQTEVCLFNKNTAREALSLPQNAFIFGNVARLVPHKDQATMIKAFAMIKPQCPLAKLVIIGDGKLSLALKTQVKELNMQADIIFTGAILQAHRYFKAFDSFVLTSTQESFGFVLLEAMIAKLPIIATNVYGIPEVLANTGRLIKARESVACANTMLEIYHLSLLERTKMGNAAYERVRTHFSFSTFKTIFWEQLNAYRLYHHI